MEFKINKKHMLGTLVHFHDSDRMMYTRPAICTEYGNVIYINLVNELGMVILQAVNTEANSPISL
jgi:hypothetical protein